MRHNRFDVKRLLTLKPLQALAILEEEAGNIEAARELFEKGSKADPKHLHIWQVRVCVLAPPGPKTNFQMGVHR